MTIEEFNERGWHPFMKAKYEGKVYPISCVDFQEKLIALTGIIEDTDDVIWVRCENVEVWG